MAQRVAVVDDDADLGMVFRDVLEEGGYEAVLCPTVVAAEQCLQEAVPDAILLDVHVGTRGAGWQLLRRIRDDERLSALPIIVCTADARDIALHAEEIARHRCAVLPKPFDLDALLCLLDRVLALAGPASP